MEETRLSLCTRPLRQGCTGVGGLRVPANTTFDAVRDRSCLIAGLGALEAEAAFSVPQLLCFTKLLWLESVCGWPLCLTRHFFSTAFAVEPFWKRLLLLSDPSE